MISQNLQYVVEFLQNRWFVEHLSEFCRNYFCYFQIPCFHFHITLFKQILKPELRGIPDNCRMSSYFALIFRKIREYLRHLAKKGEKRREKVGEKSWYSVRMATLPVGSQIFKENAQEPTVHLRSLGGTEAARGAERLRAGETAAPGDQPVQRLVEGCAALRNGSWLRETDG